MITSYDGDYCQKNSAHAHIKKGKDNVTAEALSRMLDADFNTMEIPNEANVQM